MKRMFMCLCVLIGVNSFVYSAEKSELGQVMLQLGAYNLQQLNQDQSLAVCFDKVAKYVKFVNPQMSAFDSWMLRYQQVVEQMWFQGKPLWQTPSFYAQMATNLVARQLWQEVLSFESKSDPMQIDEDLAQLHRHLGQITHSHIRQASQGLNKKTWKTLHMTSSGQGDKVSRWKLDYFVTNGEEVVSASGSGFELEDGSFSRHHQFDGNSDLLDSVREEFEEFELEVTGNIE